MCAIPHKLEFAHTVIFDIHVAGEELIANDASGSDLGHYRVLENDDGALSAVMTDSTGINNIRINKQNRSFRWAHTGESDIDSEGDCINMEGQ